MVKKIASQAVRIQFANNWDAAMNRLMILHAEGHKLGVLRKTLTLTAGKRTVK